MPRVVVCPEVIFIVLAECVFAAAGVASAGVDAASLSEATAVLDSHTGAVSIAVNKSRWNRLTPKTFRRFTFMVAPCKRIHSGLEQAETLLLNMNQLLARQVRWKAQQECCG
jgi:hypothetical protein